MTNYTEDDLRNVLADEASRTPPPVDVWARLRRRVVIRRWVRTGVAVGVAGAAAAVILVGLPAGSDPTRVSVTDGAATTWAPTRPLSDVALQRAVDVLRQRLDALGVTGATINTAQGAIRVDAPGLSDRALGQLMTPGVVQFRPVFAVKASGTAAPPVDAAARSLGEAEHSYVNSGCPSSPSEPAASTSASDYLIACSSDGATDYLLGRAVIDNASIAHAAAVQGAGVTEWMVELQFDPTGADAFHSLTAAAARKAPLGACSPPAGCNSIGIVVDGTIASAPSVQPRGGIRGGAAEITGDLTKEQARVLAALAAGPPLPTAFAPRG